MGGKRDRSFDRKLENALVARLQAGHDPADLLAELRTRLAESEAQSFLARAEDRAADLRRPRRDMSSWIPVWIACAWAAILILQNISIIAAGLRLSPTIGAEAPFVLRLIVLPTLKIGLLLATAFAVLIRRSIVTSILFAAAILYVFPLGLFLDTFLILTVDAPDPEMLTSISSLLSYAAAILVVVGYALSRRDARARGGIDTFD